MERSVNDKLKSIKRFRIIRNIAILAALMTLLFRFVIGVSFISGNSMSPSLENRDLVLFSRIKKTARCGEVIALKLPSGDKYVKRVVAEAGDTVDIRDGIIFVNDLALDDKVTLEEQGSVTYPLTIPEGTVFTLGDNRPESIDSRFYGPINIHQIQGTLKLRFHNFHLSKVG